MRSAKGRVSARELASALEQLGVVLRQKERDALFHLAELSEAFETVQACMEAVAHSRQVLQDRSRADAVSQVSQWLTDIQVDLYSRILPMHLRPLKSRLSSLIDRICVLEDECEKTDGAERK